MGLQDNAVSAAKPGYGKEPPKTMRPQVGQLVNNKYRLVGLLGDGGMGSVYEAKHEVLGSSVALKFLHPELARRSGLVQRFLQEARVSATVQSPHVVRVSDVEQTPDGLPFMVMEMLAGKSLQALYEELYRAGQRLSYDDAMNYALQMLDGLEAAHDENVVHRDLKPDNVMIVSGRRGEAIVKILDFGIAKLKINGELYKGLTRPGVIMGTPEYMAPEQVFSADKVDVRADIFSCGVMFFEMLAGRRPVGGDEPHQIAAQYLAGNTAKLRELAPHIAPGLAAAIEKSMAPDPANRFGSVRELREALLPFVNRASGPGASTPPPATPANSGSSLSGVAVGGTPQVTNGGATEKVAEPYRGSNPPASPQDAIARASGPAAEYAAISAKLKAAAGEEFGSTVEAAPFFPGATEAYQPIADQPRPGGTDLGHAPAAMPATATYAPAVEQASAMVGYSPSVSVPAPLPARSATRAKKGLGMGSILLMGMLAAGVAVGGLYAYDQAGRSSSSSSGSKKETLPLPTQKPVVETPVDRPTPPAPTVFDIPTAQPTQTSTPVNPPKPNPGPKPPTNTPPPWVLPSAIPVPTGIPGLPDWGIPGMTPAPAPQPDPGRPKLEPIKPGGALERPRPIPLPSRPLPMPPSKQASSEPPKDETPPVLRRPIKKLPRFNAVGDNSVPETNAQPKRDARTSATSSRRPLPKP